MVGLELPVGRLGKVLKDLLSSIQKRNLKTVDQVVRTGERMVGVWRERPKYRYCLEFLLQSRGVSREDVIESLKGCGDSLMVVGEPKLFRIHIHTNDPEAVKGLAAGFGRLLQPKLDDIYQQQAELLSPDGTLQEGIGVVAVTHGEGLVEIFRSLGATRVISNRKAQNPSIQELLQEIEGTGQKQVIVLPNDPNVVMAAEQAARLSINEVAVIPSRTVPEGLAALVAFDPAADLKTNREELQGALSRVKTGAVAISVRPSWQGDLMIKRGEIIGLFEEEIRLKGADPELVARDLVRMMVDNHTRLISIYYAHRKREGVSRLADLLKKDHPDHDLQCYYGGQPHYLYIIAVE